MGRRKIYTDAEKKLLKHYRNQIYYNKKVVANLENAGLKQTGVKNGADFLYGSKRTLKSVRSDMGDIPSDDPILEYFSDDHIYKEVDAREYALQDDDFKKALDPWLDTLHLGNLEDYKKYTRAKAKVENAEAMLSILGSTSWKAE